MDGGRFWTVTSLAQELGVTPRTTRVYTQRDRARMILILRGKRLGFSLREIGEFLDLYNADPAHAGQTRALLAAVRHRIADLEEQLAALTLSLEELRELETQSEQALLQAGERRTEAVP